MVSKPAAVVGSTTTVKTMADGTLRISLDIEPRDASAAFNLFGAPGTPVALARLTNESAVAATQPQPEDYGSHYQALHPGWFNSSRVIAAFGVQGETTPEGRIRAIKQIIYDELMVTSLKEVEPAKFVGLCEALNISDTLPREIREAV